MILNPKNLFRQSFSFLFWKPSPLSLQTTHTFPHFILYVYFRSPIFQFLNIAHDLILNFWLKLMILEQVDNNLYLLKGVHAFCCSPKKFHNSPFKILEYYQNIIENNTEIFVEEKRFPSSPFIYLRCKPEFLTAFYGIFKKLSLELRLGIINKKPEKSSQD